MIFYGIVRPRLEEYENLQCQLDLCGRDIFFDALREVGGKGQLIHRHEIAGGKIAQLSISAQEGAFVQKSIRREYACIDNITQGSRKGCLKDLLGNAVEKVGVDGGEMGYALIQRAPDEPAEGQIGLHFRRRGTEGIHAVDVPPQGDGKQYLRLEGVTAPFSVVAVAHGCTAALPIDGAGHRFADGNFAVHGVQHDAVFLMDIGHPDGAEGAVVGVLAAALRRDEAPITAAKDTTEKAAEDLSLSIPPVSTGITVSGAKQ